MATIDKNDTHQKVMATVATVLHKELGAIKFPISLEQLGADSLDKIEIVMRLEDQFDIQIDDDTIDTHTHLQQTIDYIHTLRG